MADAIRELRDNPVDVVFYDPEDKGSGPGFSLLEANSTVPMVLISKNPHLALRAYEYRNAVDYLLHPLQESRVEESMNRIVGAGEEAVRKQATETRPLDYIFVNVNKRLVRIDLEDIHYLAAKGDYITIYTQRGVFTTHGTLKSLVPKLSGCRFVDVHRSYLVNMDHVVDISVDSIQVGDAIIPVSRLKRKKLLKNIMCL
ncbi:LytR/AlgR family response regulator transcription factor [Flagellimonas marinaquae]